MENQTLPTVCGQTPYLNPDPFNLIERDLIGGAVVQLCRPRALMRGDRLRVLDANRHSADKR